MDLYERLSRLLMRRKYARVLEDRGDDPPLMMAKSKSVKVPRETRSEKKLKRRQSKANNSEPPVVVTMPMPKRFTLHSSNNEVVDGAWFNNALRRSVAEGRLNLRNVL